MYKNTLNRRVIAYNPASLPSQSETTMNAIHRLYSRLHSMIVLPLQVPSPHVSSQCLLQLLPIHSVIYTLSVDKCTYCMPQMVLFSSRLSSLLHVTRLNSLSHAVLRCVYGQAHDIAQSFLYLFKNRISHSCHFKFFAMGAKEDE